MKTPISLQDQLGIQIDPQKTIENQISNVKLMQILSTAYTINQGDSKIQQNSTGDMKQPQLDFNQQSFGLDLEFENNLNQIQNQAQLQDSNLDQIYVKNEMDDQNLQRDIENFSNKKKLRNNKKERNVIDNDIDLKIQDPKNREIQIKSLLKSKMDNLTQTNMDQAKEIFRLLVAPFQPANEIIRKVQKQQQILLMTTNDQNIMNFHYQDINIMSEQQNFYLNDQEQQLQGNLERDQLSKEILQIFSQNSVQSNVNNYEVCSTFMTQIQFTQENIQMPIRSCFIKSQKDKELLNYLIKKQKSQNKDSLTLAEINKGCKRNTASKSFLSLLFLQATGDVNLYQQSLKTFEDISIKITKMSYESIENCKSQNKQLLDTNQNPGITF